MKKNGESSNTLYIPIGKGASTMRWDNIIDSKT